MEKCDCYCYFDLIPFPLFKTIVVPTKLYFFDIIWITLYNNYGSMSHLTIWFKTDYDCKWISKETY